MLGLDTSFLEVSAHVSLKVGPTILLDLNKLLKFRV